MGPTAARLQTVRVRPPPPLCYAFPKRKAPDRPPSRHPSSASSARAMSGEEVGDASQGSRAPNVRRENPNLVKRKVALHVGYVGTGYQGLQFTKQEHVKTIEADLLHAIYMAELITDDNRGDLDKVKWSRSSRTDKGVHSLATVVALKVMVDEARFNSDPEGIGLAQAISKFLPPQIMVFSVQRVNKHFRARQFCIERTYRYYLPASALCGEQDVAPGSAAEVEALGRFRKALATFEGRHPFHNYTKMKKYRDNPMDSFKGPDKDWKAPLKRKLDTRPAEDASEQQEKKKTKSGGKKVTLDEDSDVDVGRDEPGGSTRGGAAPDELEKLAWGALTQEEIRTGRFRFWNFEFKEKHVAESEGDVVVPAHYREIRQFTASDPEPIVPGGVRAICVEVVGVSFMLHQIRYMISTAACVAQGYMSFSVLDATLNASIRVNLSLAPPHPLILSSCRFMPFPGNGASPAIVSKWSGPELTLQNSGAERQAAFSAEVLLPAINELLEKPEWETWSKNLYLFSYNEGMQDVNISMQAFSLWHYEHMRAREERIKSFEERGIDKSTYWKIQKNNRAAKGRVKAAVKAKKPDDHPQEGTQEETRSCGSIWGWLGSLFRRR